MSNSNSDNSDSVNSSSPKVKRKRKSKASGPEAPPDFQTAQERVREALRNSPKNSRPPPPPPRPDESEDFSIEELLAFDRYDDPDALIGKFRWLTRGSSLIVQGYTGIGKSSLLLQMAMHWSLGRDFFGMWIQKPFRCLFIQAENNRGDIAEPFQDICRNVLGIEPTSPEIKV